MFYGMIGSIEKVIFSILLSALFIYTLYLIIKNESGANVFAWILAVLVLPILGSGIYLWKHFSSKK